MVHLIYNDKQKEGEDMGFFNAVKKYVFGFTNFKEKEVSKMKKKIIAIAVVIAVTLAYTVAPAMAYTVIGGTAVSITASGTIAGNTVAFSAVVTDTAGAGSGSTIAFTSPSGKTNSGKLLKITGGTNLVGARIIIGTDNNALFADPNNDPRVNTAGKYSGSDGSGMVGATVQGYIAALYWGASDTPNTPAAYTFGATNWSWIVDKWHNHTFVPTLADGVTIDPNYASLDTASFYKVGSTTAETNLATEGSGAYKSLYPQYWDQDLYDKPSTDSSRKVFSIVVGGVPQTVGQALYKNIATVAYGIQTGSNTVLAGSDGYFICQVPKLSTTDASDYVLAKLAKTDGTTGSYIYLAIGGDFTGLPAQAYSTPNLFVAMVQDS